MVEKCGDGGGDVKGAGLGLILIASLVWPVSGSHFWS
jgi:hypothetical protein